MNKILVFIFCTFFCTLLMFSCEDISRYDKGAQFIAIQPFEETDQTSLNTIKSSIEDFYGYDVTILETRSLPEKAYYPRLDSYRTADVNNYLKTVKPDSFTKIVGIINAEISKPLPPNNELYIVLAASERKGCVSLISTKRIRESTHNSASYQSALEKITLHEMGHTLGLKHCKSEDECLMKDFQGSISRLEKQGKKLCDECSNKLGWGIPH